MAYLEQWFYMTAPRHHSPCLSGYIFGDEDLPDGSAIMTTPIVSMDPEQDFVMTHDALYALGSSRHENAWEQRALRRGKQWLVRFSAWRFLLLPFREQRKCLRSFPPKRT